MCKAIGLIPNTKIVIIAVRLGGGACVCASVLRVPHQQRKAVEAVSVLSLMLTLFDQRAQSSPRLRM